MGKSRKRRKRPAYLPVLIGILILILAITHGNSIAKGNTQSPADQSGPTKIEAVTLQVGQEKMLEPKQVPLSFRIKTSGFSTDEGNNIDVNNEGRVLAVNPGEANVYAGNGPLRLKVAEVNIQPKKIIYLTFDDGPSRNITAKILKILQDNHIKATFFLVGQYVNYYPELVKKIDAQGEVIGIHSDTHRYRSIYKNNASLLEDVNRLDIKLERILNKRIELYRFPGGSSEVKQRLGEQNKKALISQLNQEGYRCFDWDASIGDAGKGNRSAAKMLHKVEKELNGKSRVIVLSHDMGLMTKTPTVIAGLIQYCKKEGYSFDTLDHYPGQKLFP